MSFSELMVSKLLTLERRLRRRPSEGRDVVSLEDFDNEEEEDDDDEDPPLALVAHLVIACSSTEARAPSRPPAEGEPEDNENEERMVEGVEGRAEGGGSPR